MNCQKNRHLKKEEIIQAVVDEKDMPETLRQRLSVCPLCEKEKEHLFDLLSRLGDTARATTPGQVKRVTVPAKKSAVYRGLWRRLNPGLVAAGLSVILVAGILWWAAPLKMIPQEETNGWSLEMWEQYTNMMEIIGLEDVAPPQIYLDITGEFNATTSDEFMQFLIPAGEDEDFDQYESKEARHVV